jgi:transcriptional regulator of acetoin/glycerol metabolism
MTTTKIKPPMAKAIREFLAGIRFPPAKNSDANFKSAGLILAMLQHGKGLLDGASTATCSPSYMQLTEILHCSVTTIKRQMAKLIRLGLVRSERRGHTSNQFTIYQTAQIQTDQEVIHQQMDQQVIHRNRSPRPVRQINKPVQTDHLDVQRDQQVIYTGVMPQGSSQDKTLSQESGSVKKEGIVFSEESQPPVQPVQPDQVGPSPEVPPAGIVRIDGKLVMVGHAGAQ